MMCEQNNITAYGWPSHVKTYLEAIEKEKQFDKSNKVQLGAAVLFTPLWLSWISLGGGCAQHPPPHPCSAGCAGDYVLLGHAHPTTAPASCLQKHGRTLSGLLGRRTLPSEAAATGEEHETPGGPGGAETPPMQRYYSTPQVTTKDIDAPAAVGGGEGVRKTISGVSTDDLALLQSLGQEGLARMAVGGERGAGACMPALG